MPQSNIAPRIRKRAKSMRRTMTAAEKRLWYSLRDLKARGLHFRKQAPIGPYIADFAWHGGRFIVEVDGGTHGTPEERAYDARRTAFLEKEGYRVFRCTNEDVLTNREGVIAGILIAIGEANS